MLRLGRRLVRAGAAGIGFGFLIITGFVFWVSTVATAADLLIEDEVVFEQPARVWQGCYIGASVGPSIDSTSVRSAPVTTVVTGTAGDGFAVGGYAGCNLQSGVLVLGIEGDYNGASDGPDRFGSARLRLGTTIGSDTLIYLTGGFSFADLEFAAANGAATGRVSDTVSGSVFGGGIEQSVGNYLSVRLEALHYDYEDRTLILAGGGVATVEQANTVVRVGLTFALDGLFGFPGGGGGVDPDVVQ